MSFEPGALERQASHQDHALQEYWPDERAKVEHDLYAALRRDELHQGRVLMTTNALYFLPQRGSDRCRLAWDEIDSIETKEAFIPTFVIRANRDVYTFTNFNSPKFVVRGALMHYWKNEPVPDDGDVAQSLRSISSHAEARPGPVFGQLPDADAIARAVSSPSAFNFGGGDTSPGTHVFGAGAAASASAAAAADGASAGAPARPRPAAQTGFSFGSVGDAGGGLFAQAAAFGRSFFPRPASQQSLQSADSDDVLERVIDGLTLTDNAEQDPDPAAYGRCTVCSVPFATRREATLHTELSPTCAMRRPVNLFAGSEDEEEDDEGGDDGAARGDDDPELSDGGGAGSGFGLFGGAYQPPRRARYRRRQHQLPASFGNACPFFLAGHCRDGDECTMSHGEGDHANMYQSLLRTDSEEPEGPPRRGIKAKVRAYSSTTVCKPEIRCGDKIILHQHILHAALSQEDAFPWPLSFQLVNPSNGKIIHAGVLDFTAPEQDIAFVPDWMLLHLEALDGDVIRIQAVRLPKGIACQLQPLDPSWLDIPRDHRGDILEFQLRGFQTLTEGSVISIDNERREYPFLVVQCAPEPGISIIDCDIATDILSPPEVGSSEYTNVVLGQAVEGRAEAGRYARFVVRAEKGKKLPETIFLSVTAKSGDPDLFVSQNERRPSRASYLCCAQKPGSVSLCVGNHVEEFRTWDEGGSTCLYIAVSDALADTEFTLLVRTAKDDDPLNPEPSGLFADEQSTERETPGPDQVVCEHCGHCVPSARLVMHERHCQRHTWRCEPCGFSMPTTLRAKHEAVAHDVLKCSCGAEFPQQQLHAHQQDDCPHRLVACINPWCSMAVQASALTQHSTDCSLRQTPCVLCFQEVRWRDLESHLFAMHNCKTQNIDWAKPLSEQTLEYNAPEPGQAPDPLLCKCGFRGMNTEGIQLHMLTECTRREENIVELSEAAEAAAQERQAEQARREEEMGAYVAAATAGAGAQAEHDGSRAATGGGGLPDVMPDQWACPTCTFINSKVMQKCEMCRSDQPRPPRTPSPEDWMPFGSAQSSARVSPARWQAPTLSAGDREGEAEDVVEPGDDVTMGRPSVFAAAFGGDVDSSDGEDDEDDDDDDL